MPILPPRARAPKSASLLAIASLAFAFSAASAQDGPNPAPNTTDSALTQGSNGVMTLHVGTHLVALDVAVLDWKGSPVTGLKKENFHLFEDGQEQTVKNFGRKHLPIAASDARQRLAAVAAALPSNTFTNFKPFPGGTVNVVVMDSLTSAQTRRTSSSARYCCTSARSRPALPSSFCISIRSFTWCRK